ncbi:hypothetical protein LCGC14_1695780 [marine sediment metagenome]|uniref:Uncharacterized protein n=1 Tax=marine sediment metagenome TaxID=412755 RepID=A0A0F9JZY5_9ZZZZ
MLKARLNKVSVAGFVLGIMFISTLLVFAPSQAEANSGCFFPDYYLASGTSNSDNLAVSPGTYCFVVDGIWGVERWTEWYVNGGYTGTAENDRSWWFDNYTDPTFEYTFASGTTTIIEAEVYDGNWNPLNENHKWTVCSISTEVCDGVDNDCDGVIDENLKNTYYRDSDGDGYGNPSVTTQDCTRPSGYVTNNTDCDDSDAKEHPNQTWYKDLDGDGYSDGATLVQCTRPAGYYVASELTATSGDCDDTDQNKHPNQTWYKDADGDLYSDGTNTTSCTRPPGYKVALELTAIVGDCNDNDAAIKPGVAEVCGDGIDNNCNNQIDEATDSDGDGYGACDDCNDNDNTVYPGATEVCDGKDNDCDLLVDEGFDVDSDGYTTCDSPLPDCDDTNASINPGADEVCGDGIDNNCDDLIDPPGIDADLDGYDACVDCNDTDGAIHPGATEVCDGVDNNCDKSIDEGFDVDGDTYTTCSGDCDDTNASINPGVPEECGDGIDNNCNGQIDEAVDADSDGFNACEECNDTDSSINPDATEICDGKDNNCNDQIDEGFADLDMDGYNACEDCNDNNANEHPGQTWYKDSDGDGYSDGTKLVQCTQPVGYKVASELTAASGDCNDSNSSVYPGATEFKNGMDDNCNGQVDEGLEEEGIGLEEKGPCLIATAAYGSFLDPHVKVLRDFRDDYLLTNPAGRAFVEFYYRTSPPVADYIGNHKSLRTATRWALTPVVFGIKHPAAGLLLFGLVIGIAVYRKKKK